MKNIKLVAFLLVSQLLPAAQNGQLVNHNRPTLLVSKGPEDQCRAFVLPLANEESFHGVTFCENRMNGSLGGILVFSSTDPVRCQVRQLPLHELRGNGEEVFGVRFSLS